MLVTIIYGRDSNRRQLIEEIIRERIMVNNSLLGYDMEIVLATDNTNDLGYYLENHKKKAIVIIADMQNEDEINDLKQISDYDGFLESIYLLNNEELIWQLVENRIEPLDVIRLRKYNIDELIERIRENIDIVYRKYGEANIATHANLFTYSKENGKFDRIDRKEIIAFESIPYDNQKVTMHLKDESIDIFGSLKKYEELLKENNFFRCNRNIIVNIDNVIKFNKSNKSITMKNGRKISVSIRKLKDAKLMLEN